MKPPLGQLAEASALLLLGFLAGCASPEPSRTAASEHWSIGVPIVTYWAGPSMTDATAKQMADGGWNLVWCNEAELDTVQRHDLRAQLHDGLLAPASLEDAAQKTKLDALLARVRSHPALYAYFITDEPNATNFAGLGKLVAYLRERDPAHLAYINLIPTYATNEQLGNKGDKLTAYREHLSQYIDIVRPSLISYDHYQFRVKGDDPDYFLNLDLIRRAAQQAEIPFLNIVQACTWTSSMRVPTPDEMRYLVYTTLAYGAQGISYYVYSCAGHTGMIAHADGTPTERYDALRTLNREFVAISEQLQSYQCLDVYHCGMLPPGTAPLPKDAPFRLEPSLPEMEYKPPQPAKGILLGYFGPNQKRGGNPRPTHVVVVNLDYSAEAVVNLVGPRRLELFDATRGTWSRKQSERVELRLPRGGGMLARMKG